VISLIIWLVGVGFAVSLAGNGEWLLAIGAFVLTNFVTGLTAPRSWG
jgi:hypothetical protein